jgi:membrane-associated phospholipid phosphatase
VIVHVRRWAALFWIFLPLGAARGQDFIGKQDQLDRKAVAPNVVAEWDAALTALQEEATTDPSSTEPDQQQSPPTQNNPNASSSQASAKKKTFFRSLAHDEYRIWTAPFRRGNYDSHSMKKYGLPFLLISAGAIASDRKTSEWLPNTLDQEIWSGRVSQIGAAYTLAGFAGTTYLIGAARDDRHSKETGLLALQAIAHTQLVVLVLKEITQRERPIVDKRRVGFWKGGDSFPSGHAASSFAVAAVFAYEYRDHIAVPITAYSIASIVSASRMSARRHWVSDIFVGGSLGFMIGRFTYKRHHDPILPGSPVERRSSLSPEVGVGSRGIALSWHW